MRMMSATTAVLPPQLKLPNSAYIARSRVSYAWATTRCSSASKSSVLCTVQPGTMAPVVSMRRAIERQTRRCPDSRRGSHRRQIEVNESSWWAHTIHMTRHVQTTHDRSALLRAQSRCLSGPKPSGYIYIHNTYVKFMRELTPPTPSPPTQSCRRPPDWRRLCSRSCHLRGHRTLQAW